MKHIFHLLSVVCLFSVQIKAITELSSLSLQDTSNWRSASEAGNSHLWISDNYVYWIQPDILSGNLTIGGSAEIPSNYKFQVALFAQYDEFQNTFNIVLIPKSSPTTILEAQIDISSGDWSTLRQTTIEGVPNNINWQQIISDQSEIPGDIYIFSIGYVASISYDNFQYLTTQTIPGDPFFPISHVSGSGIAPPFALEGAALYASRASANASKGGDIALFKVSIPGYMEYDHSTYLLQSPDVFFVYGSGLSPYLYWLQNNFGTGTLYCWNLQQEQISSLDVQFSNSGEGWGPAWALESYGNYALLVSGINTETAGYTLHTINLNGFDQSDYLFVPSDDLPQLALEADYGSSGYAVVGTRNGNYLKLVFYQYAPNKRSIYQPMPSMNKFNVEYEDDHGLPPTCSNTPKCGPSIGLTCNNPANCYLDNKAFICCTSCPDDC